MAMGKPLRIFFFSDWRIQSLELAEKLIQSIAPVDIIVYGGDDVARFAPPPEIPATMTIADRTYFPESFIPLDEMSDVLLALSEQMGQEPKASCTGRELTLRQMFALYRDPSPANNWLTKFAQYAHYGVLGIIGNDGDPADRAVLHAPGVRDLHAKPTIIENVGFLGIEGAISNGSRNAIGLAEEEVREHLWTSLRHLEASPERLIIVTHTPPAGCRLDIGIRFGFEYLGSEALKNFILEYQPALVLCGHCHNRGGKSALLGSTLVVNAASDNTNPRHARAALIELGESPTVTWLTPPPGLTGPDIGPKRAATLASYGITQLEEILENSAVRTAIQFSTVRTARLRTYIRAQAENTPVWLERPELPKQLLFYDVETGLNLGGVLGQPQEPWIIAVSDGTEVKQWAVPEEDRKRRRTMYREFLAYVHAHPKYTLCSWSGSSFDERMVEAGISRWDSKRLPVWNAVPKLDLLRALKRCLVLPIAGWSLKEVATWCGFAYTSDLDGFEVGLHYEEYRASGEPLPFEEIARYNVEDVRALALVAERLLQISPNVTNSKRFGWNWNWLTKTKKKQ
ncbi:hypothetical protein ccbrp13_21330 [Ktedonobacteria bacterium brp13]|nr:hypothetical protein ccbrp13_21330 [Ktedonobacteria bacterium brp13]